MDESKTSDTLPVSFKNFTFDEAIQYIKANPGKFMNDDLGLYVIQLIKQGNSKKLKRWWLGHR